MEKEFLEECLAKGMSLPQIGEVVGRPPGTVGYWVAKHGLVANGSEKFSPGRGVPVEDLRRRLDDGLTLAQIGLEFGVAASTVGNWIKRAGLSGTRATERIKMIRNARAAGAQSLILECGTHGLTDFALLSGTGVRCRKCSSDAVIRRRRLVKQILVEEAGGACVLCGYNLTPRALHFHHLDPATKSFAVSRSGVTRGIAEARDEAAKCVLLCSNCHAEVEDGLVDLSLRLSVEGDDDD